MGLFKSLMVCSVATLGYIAVSGQQQQTIEVTKRVAHHVIRNTTYRFVDTKTRKTYNSLEEMPDPATIQVESVYNKWDYSNGVMATGMMALANTLQDTSYLQYVGRNFNFVFSNIAFAEKNYATYPRIEFYHLLRMDRLDDCGALGAALAEYHQLYPNKSYQEYVNKAITYVTAKQHRLPGGAFCRKEPRSMTVWADDLYMSVPFLSVMGKYTGNQQYIDDAIKQVKQFDQLLYDEHTGLYFHGWYSDVQQNSVAHWLRSNGWLAMAQAALLHNLPAAHPERKILTDLLLKQIIGFSRYQDTTGLWHQLIDKPGSYLETSGTAMFVYAVAKAVNEKWIPASYCTIAEDGWKGLMKKVTADGEVEDVCIGTGLRDNIGFYYSRPKQLNDFHVAGAFLLAGTEMIRMYNSGIIK